MFVVDTTFYTEGEQLLDLLIAAARHKHICPFCDG